MYRACRTVGREPSAGTESVNCSSRISSTASAARADAVSADAARSPAAVVAGALPLDRLICPVPVPTDTFTVGNRVRSVAKYGVSIRYHWSPLARVAAVAGSNVATPVPVLYALIYALTS